MHNVPLSDGATALFFPIVFATPHSFYRDLNHLKYMNGKFVASQEEFEPSEPDLKQFLPDGADYEPSVISTFRKQHPTENVKFGVYKEKYLYVTERVDVNDRHQGGDFLQEDCQGRVISFLHTGQIFNYETFTSAVRRCQAYQEIERMKGHHGPSVISRRPKYLLEIQIMAAIVLDLNEDPAHNMDLGELNEDVMRLRKIGLENYERFFKLKLQGIKTGSIKLKPAFLSKKDAIEFEKIENKTKDEIRSKIKVIIDSLEFDDDDEKTFYTVRCNRPATKKDELVNLFNDLATRSVLFSSDKV